MLVGRFGHEDFLLDDKQRDGNQGQDVQIRPEPTWSFSCNELGHPLLPIHEHVWTGQIRAPFQARDQWLLAQCHVDRHAPVEPDDDRQLDHGWQATGELIDARFFHQHLLGGHHLGRLVLEGLLELGHLGLDPLHLLRIEGHAAADGEHQRPDQHGEHHDGQTVVADDVIEEVQDPSESNGKEAEDIPAILDRFIELVSRQKRG